MAQCEHAALLLRGASSMGERPNPRLPRRRDPSENAESARRDITTDEKLLKSLRRLALTDWYGRRGLA
jgi:hypothetical protein